MTPSRWGSKASLIQALRVYGSMPRCRLADLTGLSRATVSGAINELMRVGLVEETNDRFTTGGRPAINVRLTAGSRAVIGADLDDQAWTLAAFDLPGNRLHVEQVPIGEGTPEAAVAALRDALHPFIDRLGVAPVPLLGLGVPGLVDSQNGSIRAAVDVGWVDVHMGEAVNRAVGWPVVILNRHRARGLAECRYGAAAHHSEVLYVGVGTGIAAGLFVQGQLVTGTVGGAGEVGHTTIAVDGPLCSCGNQGCLQALAAGPAIVQEARRRIRDGVQTAMVPNVGYDVQLLQLDDICKAANAGDSLAREILQEAGSYLGVALANLVNIMNPEIIVLGGSVPRRSSHYVQAAEQSMRQRSLGPLVAATVVKTAQLAEAGGALGAASYALDQHVQTLL